MQQEEKITKKLQKANEIACPKKPARTEPEVVAFLFDRVSAVVIATKLIKSDHAFIAGFQAD